MTMKVNEHALRLPCHSWSRSNLCLAVSLLVDSAVSFVNDTTVCRSIHFLLVRQEQVLKSRRKKKRSEKEG